MRGAAAREKASRATRDVPITTSANPVPPKDAEQLGESNGFPVTRRIGEDNKARMPGVETVSGNRNIPLQLVLAGRCSERIGRVVFLDRFRRADPKLARLPRIRAQFVDPPLRIENRLKVTTIILIHVVHAFVQIEQSEVGFPQIDLKRRRLKLASVEGDGIVERNKDSRVYPTACREIDRERKEEKAQPHAK
jgi:hypothetical protein